MENDDLVSSEIGRPYPSVAADTRTINRWLFAHYRVQKELLDNTLVMRWPSLEEYVVTDAGMALEFALNFCGRGQRFLEGEKAIAQHPGYSYKYAKLVVKGRFVTGEKTIAGDRESAYKYARCVLKGRFSLAENLIAQDPRWAYRYAKDVLHGRFLKAEKVIARHPAWAYWYAIYVLKGRFLAAENAIAQCAYWAYRYSKDVLGARFPEAEREIATHPTSAYWYARNVLKGRFQEAEPVIIATSRVANRYYQEFMVSDDLRRDVAGLNPYFAYRYARDVVRGRLPRPLHRKMMMWALSEKYRHHWFVQRYLLARKYQ